MDGEVRRRVEEVVRAALLEVCPEEVGILQSKRQGVKHNPDSSKSSDFILMAPLAIFRKLSRGEQQATVVIETVSDMGRTIIRDYASPAKLARTIARVVTEDPEDRIVSDCRSSEEGFIYITTMFHVERQRAEGKLLCEDCGRFFSGDRGLRDHQQIQHKETYEVSKEKVKRRKNEIVQYSELVGPRLFSTWVSEAEARKEDKSKLSPFLEAAKNGDIKAMRSVVGEHCRTKGCGDGRTGWDRGDGCGKEIRADVEVLDGSVTKAACEGGCDCGCRRGCAYGCGFDFEQKDRHGSNALLWAAGGGHLDACVYLVRECRLPVRGEQVKDGRNALHWAARNGRLEVCRWLVEDMKCTVNTATKDGTTAFHWAVWQTQFPVCEWMVKEAGVDFKAMNSFGCNAIQWAAQSGSVDMCRWLKDIGLDIAIFNNNGHSAIHKAALKGKLQVCRYLLSDDGGLGVEHLQPDLDGNTPAEMARLEGHKELSDFLVEWEREARGAFE